MTGEILAIDSSPAALARQQPTSVFPLLLEVNGTTNQFRILFQGTACYGRLFLIKILVNMFSNRTENGVLGTPIRGRYHPTRPVLIVGYTAGQCLQIMRLGRAWGAPI